VRPIVDDGARVAALEAGDVDIIHAFPPLDAQRLQTNTSLQVLNPLFGLDMPEKLPHHNGGLSPAPEGPGPDKDPHRPRP